MPLFGTRVSPRFGFAAEMLVAEVEGGSAGAIRKLSTAGMSAQQIVGLLAAQGVETIICSGINGFCHSIAAARGIQVIPGVIGEAEDALEAFAAGRLKPGVVQPAGRRGRLRRRGTGGPPWWGSG